MHAHSEGAPGRLLYIEHAGHACTMLQYTYIPCAAPCLLLYMRALPANVTLASLIHSSNPCPQLHAQGTAACTLP